MKSRGRNHVWEERQSTRKLIQRKGGTHCDGYRIGDSRLLAEPQYLPVGKTSFADSEPVDGKATRLELRPNRKKGRKLSAQFKAKAPPFCTGGSGLLHTKCVSISVKPLRTHFRTKSCTWCTMRLQQGSQPVVQWAYRKRASRWKGVRYERKAVGIGENHSIVRTPQSRR